ncbi:MAG: hypoxanthine phosphoribosyltransferase [Bacteriovoracia bacterium]
MELPKILISEAKIRQKVQELANEISFDHRGKEVTVLCVLRGSYIFFADLIRKIELPIHCEFVGLSSYGDKTESSGEVKLTLDVTEPLKDRHVVVVEDIVDTGYTMQYLMTVLQSRHPASIKVCSLLVKPEAMKTKVEIDYVGFKLGREFVVGYGLDYAGKFRNLPYIGILEHEH